MRAHYWDSVPLIHAKKEGLKGSQITFYLAFHSCVMVKLKTLFTCLGKDSKIWNDT